VWGRVRAVRRGRLVSLEAPNPSAGGVLPRPLRGRSALRLRPTEPPGPLPLACRESDTPEEACRASEWATWLLRRGSQQPDEAPGSRACARRRVLVAPHYDHEPRD